MACRVRATDLARLAPALPPAFGVRVAVPVPPSVNSLYLNVRGRGRVPTPAYRAWRAAAEPVIAAKLPPPPSFPVEVCGVILPGKGWRVTADVGNREKALTDALVAAGVLPDDRQRYVAGVRLAVDDAARSAGPTLVLVWLVPAVRWW
jgi:crossover junction endodeoxyribonuclease RusA